MMMMKLGVVMLAVIVLAAGEARGRGGMRRTDVGERRKDTHRSMTWAQVMSPPPTAVPGPTHAHTHSQYRRSDSDYDDDFFANDDYEYVDTEDANYRLDFGMVAVTVCYVFCHSLIPIRKYGQTLPTKPDVPTET